MSGQCFAPEELGWVSVEPREIVASAWTLSWATGVFFVGIFCTGQCGRAEEREVPSLDDMTNRWFIL